MVSVIIPTYNRAEKVKKAVISVLEQTWSDLEVIVVDDGSTDNTKTTLESIFDSRLRYCYQENAGACVARNRGIELAKGEYIAFHDSDDVWHRDKLEKQMRIFEQFDVDLVFCKLKKILPEGSYKMSPLTIEEGILNPVQTLFGIGTQTIVAKRKVFEQYQFDVDFPRLQEFELLYRIAQSFTLYCVNEGLVDYVVGADSISSNPRKMYLACKLVLEKHPEIVDRYPVMGSWMAQLLLSAAATMKNRGDCDYTEPLKLAYKCRMNVKIHLKAFLIKSGLYVLLHK